MSILCCVIGCTTNNNSNTCDALINSEDLSKNFFSFPLNKNFEKKWLIAAGLPISTSTKNKWICKDHFLESSFYYLEHGIIKLKLASIPKLNLPNMEINLPNVKEKIKHMSNMRKRNEKRLTKEPAKKQSNKIGDKIKNTINEGLTTIELNEDKISKICRMCLFKDDNLRNIFKEKLEDIIFNLTSIKVSPNDGYPQNMCQNCINRLMNADIFVNLCTSSKIAIDEFRSNKKNKNNIQQQSSYVISNDISFSKDKINNPMDTDQVDEEVIQIFIEPADITTDPLEINKNEFFDLNCKTGFDCNLCGQKFSKFYTYQAHKIRHKSEPSQFCCKYCGKTENNALVFAVHIETCAQVAELRNKPTLFKCGKCNFMGLTHEKLELHKIQNHFNHKCNYCGKLLANLGSLKKHKIKQHKCKLKTLPILRQLSTGKQAPKL